ncbi:MAG: amidohydrolase family protein [Steroidobacteraceae bacterium]
MRQIFGGCVLMALAVCADAAQSYRYDVYFSGQLSGSEVARLRTAGDIEVKLSYRDNGRGPDLRERLMLGSESLPVGYSASGTSTYGAPIKETFTLVGGKASWKSLADAGGKQVTAAAVYAPVEYSFTMGGLIARAAVRAGTDGIDILPAGHVTAATLSETTLTQDGHSIVVRLHALVGLDSRPQLIWLTADQDQRFFAYVYPGYMQVIDSQWNGQAGQLETLQVQQEATWLQDRSRRQIHTLDRPLVLRNTRIFDSETAQLRAPADVYVSGNKIAAIYPVGSVPAEDVYEIDATGKVLAPGLFDMHAHQDAFGAPLQIAGGVTTIRDMGNDNAALARIAQDIKRGVLAGPDIVACGFLEGSSPFASSGGLQASTLEQALEAVDWYAQHGFRQIKIYNSFRPEWVKPVAAHAHSLGMRVSGHIPAFMHAAEAVRDGYDEIQHINQVLLNFLAGPKDDTRTLARFYLIGEKMHTLDLDSKEVAQFIDLLRDHQIVIDPTLATFEASFRQLQGEPDPMLARVLDHLPAATQRARHTNSTNVTPGNIGKYRAAYAAMLKFTAQMWRAGIELVAGTDEIEGFTLHRELELYVEAGIAPAQALRIATWNGAKVTGLLADRGSIAAGKRADLILIDGDPTTDISAIRKISAVLKDGALYYPSEIYESMGIRPFTAPPALVPIDKQVH